MLHCKERLNTQYMVRPCYMTVCKLLEEIPCYIIVYKTRKFSYTHELYTCGLHQVTTVICAGKTKLYRCDMCRRESANYTDIICAKLQLRSVPGKDKLYKSVLHQVKAVICIWKSRGLYRCDLCQVTTMICARKGQVIQLCLFQVMQM